MDCVKYGSNTKVAESLSAEKGTQAEKQSSIATRYNLNDNKYWNATLPPFKKAKKERSISIHPVGKMDNRDYVD